MSTALQTLRPIYDVPGAAEVWGVTPRTVYSWIYAGHIETVRLGRLVRIRGAEVGRIIDEGVPRSGQ